MRRKWVGGRFWNVLNRLLARSSRSQFGILIGGEKWRLKTNVLRKFSWYFFFALKSSKLFQDSWFSWNFCGDLWFSKMWNVLRQTSWEKRCPDPSRPINGDFGVKRIGPRKSHNSSVLLRGFSWDVSLRKCFQDALPLLLTHFLGDYFFPVPDILT